MKTKQFKEMLKRGAACFLIATLLVGGPSVAVLAGENNTADETIVIEENNDIKIEDTEEIQDITDETSIAQEESIDDFVDEKVMEDGNQENVISLVSSEENSDSIDNTASVQTDNAEIIPLQKSEEELASSELGDNLLESGNGGSIAQAIWTRDNGTLTFYYGPQYEEGDLFKGYKITNVWSGSTVTNTSTSIGPEWIYEIDMRELVNKVEFDSTFSVVKPHSTYCWFYFFESLESVDLRYLDTSEVTNMDSMFFDCHSLTSIDVSGFDTSKVINMNYMFRGCTRLKHLDVSGFDTSHVKYMSYMFANCTKLTNIDISRFDTSRLSSMDCMFAQCIELTSIDISGFRIQGNNLLNTDHMFKNCYMLSTIFCSNSATDWEKQNIYTWESSTGMFEGCDSLIGKDGNVQVTYDSTKTDGSMAKSASLGGYFTPKSGTLSNGKLTLDQDEYYGNCMEPITISATYKGTTAPSGPKLLADSSTLNNNEFSNISVLGPINGEYILSLQVTPLEPGKYPFSISVNGLSANGTIITDYAELFPDDNSYAIVGEEKKLHVAVEPKDVADYIELWGDDYIEVVDWERGIAEGDLYITVRGKEPGEGTIQSDHEGYFNVLVEPKMHTVGYPGGLQETTEVPMLEINLDQPDEEYIKTFLTSLTVECSQSDAILPLDVSNEHKVFVSEDGKSGRLIYTITPVSAGSLTYTYTSPGGQIANVTVNSGTDDLSYLTSTFKYDSCITEQEAEYPFEYSDSYLLNNAYAYNHDLARFAIRLAMAGASRTHDHIADFYTKLGYQELFNHYGEPEINSIGFAIAKKDIVVAGKKICLMIVTIRGGGYGVEWAGNGNVGTGYEHEGFKKCADVVYNALLPRIKMQSDADKVKVLITGYSRAAATTNLTAQRLDYYLEHTGIDNMSRNDLFAYGFESPRGIQTYYEEYGKDIYNNIFSIVNYKDLVPNLAMNAPLTQWSFGRYGITYYLPSNELIYNFSLTGKKKDSLEEYEKIVQYAGAANASEYIDLALLQGTVFERLQKSIAHAYPFMDQYVMFAQPGVMNLLEKFNGGNVSGIKMGISLASLIETALPKVLVKDPAALAGTIGTLLDKQLKYGHYPELCLSWLDSIDGYSGYVNASTRYLRVNCPVDISVYDSKGTLVAQIKNDTVAEVNGSTIGAYIDENMQKIFVLPEDEEFKVVITATDDGVMTYQVDEENLDNFTSKRLVSYVDIPIKKGDVFIGTVDDLDKTDHGEYPLTKQDKALEPTSDKYTKDIKYFAIETKALEGGEAIGGGIFVENEYALISAEPAEGMSFIGWYSGDTCISNEAQYRFRVISDVEATAHFSNENVPVKSLYFDKDNLTFDNVGDSQKLNVKVEPANATNQTVLYTSSDETVASVNEEGRVTAKNAGTCIIRAVTEDGELVAECTVTVKEKKKVSGDSSNNSGKTTSKNSSKTTSVKTGDNTTFDIWLLLSMVSLGILIICGKKLVNSK